MIVSLFSGSDADLMTKEGDITLGLPDNTYAALVLKSESGVRLSPEWNTSFDTSKSDIYSWDGVVGNPSKSDPDSFPLTTVCAISKGGYVYVRKANWLDTILG